MTTNARILFPEAFTSFVISKSNKHYSGMKGNRKRNCDTCKRSNARLCACRRAYYCSVKCQKKAWDDHKIVCRKRISSQQAKLLRENRQDTEKLRMDCKELGINCNTCRLVNDKTREYFCLYERSIIDVIIPQIELIVSTPNSEYDIDVVTFLFCNVGVYIISCPLAANSVVFAMAKKLGCVVSDFGAVLYFPDEETYKALPFHGPNVRIASNPINKKSN